MCWHVYFNLVPWQTCSQQGYKVMLWHISTIIIWPKTQKRCSYKEHHHGPATWYTYSTRSWTIKQRVKAWQCLHKILHLLFVAVLVTGSRWRQGVLHAELWACCTSLCWATRPPTYDIVCIYSSIQACVLQLSTHAKSPRLGDMVQIVRKILKDCKIFKKLNSWISLRSSHFGRVEACQYVHNIHLLWACDINLCWATFLHLNPYLFVGMCTSI